jgi:hypothetical protein
VLVPADRLLVRKDFRPGGDDQSLYHHPHRRYVYAAGHRLPVYDGRQPQLRGYLYNEETLAMLASTPAVAGCSGYRLLE